MATIKDKIGLAMLPSAQSGGASTSTTDFSGTVHSLLPIQYTSANLVANGDFSDGNKNWNTDAGSPTFNEDAVQLVNASTISTSNSIVEKSKTYKVTYTIKSLTGSPSLGFYIGGWVNAVNNTVGTHTEEIKAGTGASLLFWVRNSNASSTIELANISVKLISNGDFDFERSSSATRVGSDGYIKNVEVLSDELVQNGDFEDVSETELVTNGDFSDGFDPNGWQDLDGHAEITDGVLTITHTATGAHRVSQSNMLTQGKFYRVSFDLIEITLTANTDFRYFDGTQYQPIPKPPAILPS